MRHLTITYTDGQEIIIGDLIFCTGHPKLTFYDIKDRFAIITLFKNSDSSLASTIHLLWENGHTTKHIYTTPSVIHCIKLVRRDASNLMTWL